MVIFKDTRRFELTVDAGGDEWTATLREYVPGRLYPTQHLLRKFDTRPAAIEALIRKWQILFPEDAPLVWREPPPMTSSRQGRRPRNRS